jgi:hypothetical protein
MSPGQQQFAEREGKTCVILQPTFLPWLGWFDLADQGDVMVILDDVAFSKQSWQQRNRIRTPNGLDFLTVPVKSSGRLGQRIADCELDNQHFVRKMIGSLQANYAKAPWFAGAIDEIAAIMNVAVASNRLVELNCALIAWIAARLEVTTPMIRAGTLATGGERGEHVAAICEHLGAKHYLSPPGAEDYLIEDKAAFDRRGISIWIHEFEHPEYSQRFAPFMPYGCSLDLIFNVGPASPAVMRSGRRTARALRENSIGSETER